jgi:Peptidase_C39 like family
MSATKHVGEEFAEPRAFFSIKGSSLRDWLAFDHDLTSYSDPTQTMLEVTRVPQDNYYYCAPASIQMVLGKFGISKLQNDIYQETRKYMQEADLWYTDPHAIGQYLASIPVVESAIIYLDKLYTEFLPIISKIAWNIITQNQPSIILINGGRHWVVAVGVTASVSNDKQSVLVTGLWIADPDRSVQGLQFKPINDDFINNYLDPVTLNGRWLGKRVAVAEKSDISFPNVIFRKPIRPAGGGITLTEAEISQLTIEDYSAYSLGLATLPLAGGAVSLIRVNIIDSTSFYYLVPLVYKGSICWSVFDVGYVLSTTSIMFADNISLPPSGNNLEKLVTSFYKNVTSFQEVNGYYWKPCIEMPSKFSIVSMAYVNDRKVYVNAQSELFEALSIYPDERLFG